MKPKQIFAVTKYNFRRWHKNPRIVITFCLAFVLCFLLSDKASWVTGAVWDVDGGVMAARKLGN